MKDVDPKALAHGFAAAAAVWREAPEEEAPDRARDGPEDGPALGHARLLGLRALRGHDRGGRREARRSSARSSASGKRPFPGRPSSPPTPRRCRSRRSPPARSSRAASSGMHFFNPVHRMPLVEVIRGERTTDETVATIFALAKTLGKTPVVVKDAPGLPRQPHPGAVPLGGGAPGRGGLPHRGRRCDDDALRHAGRAARAARRRRARRRGQGGRGAAGGVPGADALGGDDALAAAGRLGRKNGKGFYAYDGSKRGQPAPEALRGPAGLAAATARRCRPRSSSRGWCFR